MSKYAFAAAAALSALIASPAAMAVETKTGGFEVSVTIEKACTFDVTGFIKFTRGSGLAVTAPAQEGEGATATVACTTGTDYKITAGSGNLVNPFFMVSSPAINVNGSPFPGIPYQLFGKVSTDITKGTLMNTAGAYLGNRDGGSASYKFNGEISGWTGLNAPVSGDYTKYADQVTLTLTY